MRNMPTISKKGSNYMLARTQLQFLAGGAITHVNVVGVFTNSLTEIFREGNINKKVVVTLTRINSLFGWLNFHSINGHTYLHGAGDRAAGCWLCYDYRTASINCGCAEDG